MATSFVVYVNFKLFYCFLVGVCKMSPCKNGGQYQDNLENLSYVNVLKNSFEKLVKEEVYTFSYSVTIKF